MLGFGLEHVELLKDIMNIVFLKKVIAAVGEVTEFNTEILGNEAQVSHVELGM